MIPSIGFKKRDVNKQQQSLRVIELELFPPTSRHYPRFDYEQICQDLKFQTAKQQEVGQNEEFRDRDAEEIVRRLEAKYGNDTIPVSSIPTRKSKKNKKIKFAPEDVMDKGLGYVQEDDFIDDTEAYDEWIPTTMDTAKRGHYVNQGPLEFRQLDLDASTSSTTSETESSATTPEQQDSLSGEDAAEIDDLELDEVNRKSAKLKENTKTAAVTIQ